jgi:hypothetical protein
VQPVGLCGVLVQPIGIGLGQHRGEVPVAHRPCRRCLSEERQIGLGVVPDRERVILACLQPPVTTAIVQLDPATLVGMIRVVVAAAGVIGEVMGRVFQSVAVGERQPGLLTVRAGQPAEEVVERPVLHHHHDDMLDAGRGRRRQ